MMSDLNHRTDAFVSLYHERHVLGCAMYDSVQNVINICKVYRQTGLSQTIREVVRQYPAKIILVNEKLKSAAEQADVQFETLNSREYLKESIDSSLLMFSSKNAQIDKKTTILSIFGSDDEEVYKALGALTYHLLNSQTINRSFLLQNIVWVPFNDAVRISRSTMEYLDISKEQMHPCRAVQGRGKEGFTIFNMYLTFTITDMGRRLLFDIFMNPTQNRKVLEERYSTIEFMHQYLWQHEKTINKHLRKIHNLITIIGDFESIKQQEADWRRLRNSLESMVLLHRAIVACSLDQQGIYCRPEIIKKVQELEMQGISELLHLIDKSIELEPLSIKVGVSRQLDKLRSLSNEMEDMLSRYATKQSWDFQFILKFTIQIGYVIVVPRDVYDPVMDRWDLQFETDKSKTYTNELTQMLDEKYGDICAEIIDIEDELIIDLESHVRFCSQAILTAHRVLCQFDSLLALAKVSRSFTKPQLTDGHLVVLNGWHMLLGAKSINNDSFCRTVKNQINLEIYNSQHNLVNTNYSNRCCVISGPNGAGKSLYIKQTAIIVFLAHIGSYVPAELACVPIVDQIVCHRPSRSLYMEHYGLHQQVLELKKTLSTVTDQTLILIDELGHTTSQKNSIKLMEATIKRLAADEKMSSPISFIVTHLYDLFNKQYIVQGPLIRFLHATVDRKDEGDIVYEYKIRPGRFKDSLAIESCQRLGVNPNLLKKAKDIFERIRNGRTVYMEEPIRNKYRDVSGKMLQMLIKLNV